ncbi:MAG TPA: DUF6179 domain-containing protein [Candidatus Acidoferrum sp.]|nr:DUF6179 domain-containing protein [Candidatus Acidoferrum sp.]
MNNSLDKGLDRGELAALMRDRCRKYTGGMSSSVRMEVFEHLLDGVLYTIDLCEDRTLPLAEQYKRGRAEISGELRRAKLALAVARATRTKQVCTAYGETLDAGMTAFFKRYDPETSPQDCLLTLDYELALHPHELRGVTKISAYLRRLIIENRYCTMLPAGMLNRIVPPDRELIFNTFELGLRAVILTGTLLDIKDAAMAQYVKEAAKRL